MEDIHVTVSSQTEADQLREDFEEVVARVNGDLMTQTMSCDDPISVEMAVAQAEQRVDYHLSTFAENTNLQKLAGEIKARFADSIRAQARAVSPPKG